MRYLAIALLLLVPISAEAQRPNRARQNLDRILERTLEQRTDDQRPRAPRQDADDDRRDRDRDHKDRWPQTHRSWWKDQTFRYRMPFGSYYAVPYTGYGFGGYAPAPETVEDNARREVHTTTTATTGVLRLDVTPAYGLSYYVDGAFIGSSSNLGTEFALNAGARRVEVQAAGYKSLSFDTRITVGRQTTFRGALEPLTQPQPVQATGSRTIYIIPGCYVGNSRPVASALREGCDIDKLITR